MSPGPSNRGHARSSSYANPSIGSGGRADARRLHSQPEFAEFGKYAETDDEDYDDIFDKPNGTSQFIAFRMSPIADIFDSDTANADIAVEHASIQQVMGSLFVIAASVRQLTVDDSLATKTMMKTRSLRCNTQITPSPPFI